MRYLDEVCATPDVLSRVDCGEVPLLTEAPLRIFCGCGTSFYLAGQAALLCRRAGRSAAAAEAVELMENGAPAAPAGTVYAFISRSGCSGETVAAMKIARSAGYRTFYLGCAPGSVLDRSCGASCVLPFAAETLPLESFSFPAQLTALARCCGLEAPSGAIAADYARMLALGRETGRGELRGAEPGRIICLGTPSCMPLMKEIMLKSAEITQKSCELWGILEFRHGPRTWADERCLFAVLPGEKLEAEERRAAAELVSYGSRVLWFGREPLPGGLCVPVDAPFGSVRHALSVSAFMTGLAAELGCAWGVEPSRLRRLTYQVEALR